LIDFIDLSKLIFLNDRNDFYKQNLNIVNNEINKYIYIYIYSLYIARAVVSSNLRNDRVCTIETCRKEARAVGLMERISNETHRAVTLVPVIKIKNCAS